MEAPLLQVRGITKSFAKQPVLKGISLSVEAGEVFALVGGNGAGKSTLMKILMGLYMYDEGEMLVKGNPVRFSKPVEAHRQGIYLIPQEPLIFVNMTIEENVCIGIKKNKQELRLKLRDLIEELGWDLQLHIRASTLSIAQQQLVEILRGLIREAEILILDEPTSTLTAHEIKSLFTVIEKLKEKGIGMIYITHRFPEIFTIADTVAVLRDGIISSQGNVSDYTYDMLVAGLLPQGYEQPMYKKSEHTESFTRKRILVVNGLSSHLFQDVSLHVQSGEVVGLAGVIGAGRTEVAEVLYGMMNAEKGNVQLEEEDITNWSIKKRVDAGVVYVPEDRAGHGIFSIASVMQNISSVSLYKLSTFFLNKKKESALMDKYIKRFSIVVRNPNDEISSLSGGNQQKVVLGKCLASNPKFIILDEPTRGIDAKARLEVYEVIEELKRAGLAILLISSDAEEVIRLADRIYVMRNGNIVSHLEGEQMTLDKITRLAYDGEEGEEI
ncbi:sugar ABC transporter ATP-binding protein [Bacillus manliponensis]|uniref:sugar ABC transporter ATP-binding protein n=1 Tax=Bacillus manliponensis TaxID=574376 RepID=UPI0035139646